MFPTGGWLGWVSYLSKNHFISAKLCDFCFSFLPFVITFFVFFKFIFLFINLFYLFIYLFRLRWVFVAALRLSLVAASGGYSSLHCTGFSLRWLLLLRSTGFRRAGFSSCASWALECRLSSCGARASLLRGMWDLPGPGLEPVSPALAGGFLTTVPPGEVPVFFFRFHIYVLAYGICFSLCDLLHSI